MAFQDLSKHRQVASELAVKKTIYREAENPIRFAFEKILRERDKTKRTFPDIDPYVEVYTLRENIYGIYTLSLDGMGDSWIFVIEGPEKALVIDTSFGLGDLKSLIEKLLGDKEYYVANTHCHFDHAYGNYQFDKVYCHENEAPMLKDRMKPDVWDYLFDENGKGIWADFPREDLVPFKEYEIIGVPDGYTFNLGEDYDVELVFLPGHSPGHCGFLDKKSRIFFPGDDCCVGAVGAGGGPRPGVHFGEYCTIEALTKELRKVVARMDEFDALFPSHGPVETGPIMLVSLLEACEEVLADPSDYDYVQKREFQGEIRVNYCKKIFESGYLTYGPKGVYMDREAVIE